MPSRLRHVAARAGIDPAPTNGFRASIAAGRCLVYNDVHEWAYHLLPQLLRKGWGCEVRTEGELDEALATARTNTQSFSIINVHLDKLDHSNALERLGKRLGTRAGLTQSCE